MKIQAISLVFFAGFSVLNAQKYDYTWVMGGVNETGVIPYGSSTLNFNETPLETYFKVRKLNLSNGCGLSLSDAAGNLLFYTNGCAIANAKDSIMDNGNGINPGYLHNQFCVGTGTIIESYISGNQSLLALPLPGSDHEYILFHTGIENIPHATVTKLYYSKIDMSLNNGKGKVTEKNMVIFSGPMGYSEMCAVKHANGTDWWIIKPGDYDKNSYYKILLTADGPSQPVFQSFAFNTLTLYTGGQTCFSPDGNKFIRYRNEDGIYIFDFDRQTGELSNLTFVDPPEILYKYGGCAVSPNSRYLYLTNLTDLFQLDLNDPTNPASFRHIATYDGYIDNLAANFGYGQLAPDCRIYISPGNPSKVYHIIHNPDEEGTSCNFEQHALKMQAYQGSAVQHYPNYRLGPSGNEGLPCTATVPTSMPFETLQKTHISPNPNAGSFELYYKLDNTQGSSFLVYNLFGQEVYRDFLPDTEGSVHLNLTTLPDGTYFYVIPSGSGALSGKIVVEKN